MKLVTIVIPTYNRAEKLPAAIESCLNQTYNNLEIIVIDDGSSDNTNVVVENIVKRDQRVKYFYKENGGLPDALNYGFNKASGHYLTWSSDDNRYMEEAISEMVKALENSKEASFVYADYYNYFEEDDTRVHVKLAPPEFLSKNNVIGACFLYKKEIKKVIGDYNPDYKLVEDYDYWIRINKQFNIIKIDKPLYLYTRHKQSLTSERFYEIRVLDLKLKKKYGFLNFLSFYFRILLLIKQCLLEKDQNIQFKLNAFKKITLTCLTKNIN
jgi:glycosyltransferase involved in cell wall biosynthesis